MVSITAVGIVGFAKLKQDLNLMVLARTKYESSVRLIKKFLQKPSDTLKEGTVATAFMMSMFEMITYEDIGAVESWLSHIKGVTALIELRSSNYRNATTNVTGLLQVCYTTAMDCLIKNTCVSAPITELVKSSQVFQSSIEMLPASQLFHIIYEFSQIWVSATIHDITSSAEIISKAIGIDNELSSWVSELPSTWTCHTVQSKTEDMFNGTYCYTYQNSWHASVWNYYRICHILLHKFLLSTLNTLESTVSLAHPDLVSAYQLRRAKSPSVLSAAPSEIQAFDNFQLLGLLQVIISSTDASL